MDSFHYGHSLFCGSLCFQVLLPVVVRHAIVVQMLLFEHLHLHSTAVLSIYLPTTRFSHAVLGKCQFYEIDRVVEYKFDLP